MKSIFIDSVSSLVIKRHSKGLAVCLPDERTVRIYDMEDLDVYHTFTALSLTTYTFVDFSISGKFASIGYTKSGESYNVYVDIFKRQSDSSWINVQTIEFIGTGSVVSLSMTDNVLVIGLSGVNTASSNDILKIFRYSTFSNSWIEFQSLETHEEIDVTSEFGRSVDITPDGLSIIVGMLRSSGYISVFDITFGISSFEHIASGITSCPNNTYFDAVTNNCIACPIHHTCVRQQDNSVVIQECDTDEYTEDSLVCKMCPYGIFDIELNMCKVSLIDTAIGSSNDGFGHYDSCSEGFVISADGTKCISYLQSDCDNECSNLGVCDVRECRCDCETGYGRRYEFDDISNLRYVPYHDNSFEYVDFVANKAGYILLIHQNVTTISLTMFGPHNYIVPLKNFNIPRRLFVKAAISLNNAVIFTDLSLGYLISWNKAVNDGSITDFSSIEIFMNSTVVISEKWLVIDSHVYNLADLAAIAYQINTNLCTSLSNIPLEYNVEISTNYLMFSCVNHVDDSITEGIVFFFEYNNDSWGLKEILSPDNSDYKYFGHPLKISKDETELIVGFEKGLLFYERQTTGWVIKNKLITGKPVITVDFSADRLLIADEENLSIFQRDGLILTNIWTFSMLSNSVSFDNPRISMLKNRVAILVNNTFVSLLKETCNTCISPLIYDSLENNCVPTYASSLICEDGYFDNFGECQQCDGPYICISNTKQSCPNGTTPANNRTKCVECPSGRFCVEGEFPQICPINQAPFPIVAADHCEQCSSGYYGNGIECVLCHEPYVCTNGYREFCSSGQKPAGIDSCTNCILPELCPDGFVTYCPAGQYAVSLTQCNTCPDGMVCTGDSAPTGCASNQIISPDRTECLSCPTENYCIDGVVYSCNQGYTPNVTHTGCEECPQNRICLYGYAEACPEGSLPDASQTYCDVCPVGKICINGYEMGCDAGTLPNESQTECVSCPANSICEDGFAADCPSLYAPNSDQTACISCPTTNICPNGYIETCPSGQMPNSFLSYCIVCEQYHYCANGYAEQCPIGKMPSVDQTTCVDCYEGYACSPGVAITECIGTTYVNNVLGICDACPTGHYCENGQVKTCLSGFEPSVDQSSCVSCSVGKNCLNGVAESCNSGLMPNEEHSDCVKCLDNMICVDGIPQACPSGFSANYDQTACVACAAGFICPSGYLETCPTGYRPKDTVSCEEIMLSCPDGTVPNGEFTECLICPSNHICRDGIASVCSAGYQPDINKINCIECEMHKVCPNGVPVSCSANKYDSEDNIRCEECISNRICPNGYLEECPSGFIPSENGNDCVTCPVGHVCNDGLTSLCTSTTIPDSSNTSCISCPIGKICVEGIAYTCTATNMVPSLDQSSCVPCDDCLFEFVPVYLPKGLTNRTIEVKLHKEVIVTHGPFLILPSFGLNLTLMSHYDDKYVFEFPSIFDTSYLSDSDTIEGNFVYSLDSWLNTLEPIKIYSNPIFLSVEPSSLPCDSTRTVKLSGLNIQILYNPILVKLQNPATSWETIVNGTIDENANYIIFDHPPMNLTEEYEILQIIASLNNRDFPLNGMSFTRYQKPEVLSLEPSEIVSYGGENVIITVSSLFKSSNVILGLFYLNEAQTTSEISEFSRISVRFIAGNTILITTPVLDSTIDKYYPVLSLNGEDFDLKINSSSKYLTIDDSNFLELSGLTPQAVIHPCSDTSSVEFQLISSHANEDLFANITTYDSEGSLKNFYRAVEKIGLNTYRLTFEDVSCRYYKNALYVNFVPYFNSITTVIQVQTVSFYSIAAIFDDIFPKVSPQVGGTICNITGANFKILDLKARVMIGQYEVNTEINQTSNLISFVIPSIPVPTELNISVSLDEASWISTGLKITFEGCVMGYYAPTYKFACQPCPKGYYIDVEHATSCKKCEVGTYNEFEGVTSCISCPGNATSDGASSNLTDCRCKINYYGIYGEECHPCPSGATCPEGSIHPIPDPGYWASPTDLNTVIHCIPEAACSGGNSTAENATLLSSMCINGFTGDRCATCAVGSYINSDDECKVCPDIGFFSYILSLVVSFIVAFALICLTKISDQDEAPDETFETGARALDAIEDMGTGAISKVLLTAWTALRQNASFFTIGINFAQVTAMLRNFNFAWPESLKKIFNLLSNFDFNIKLVSPSCLFAVGFVQQTFLQLGLPILFIIIYIILYFTLRHKMKVDNKLAQWFRNVLAAFILLMVYLYQFLGGSALDYFDCTTLENGVSVVTNSADIVCGSPYHTSNMWLPTISVIVYIFGIPLCFLFALLYFSKKNKLENPAVKQTMGKLYENFVPEFAYWETFVMLRKLIILLCIVFLATSETDKALLSVCFLFLALLAHTFIRPYKSPKFDLVEFASLLTSMIVLFTGIVMDHAQVSSLVKSLTNAFSVLSILFTVVMFIMVVWTNIKPIKWFDNLFPADEKNREPMLFSKDIPRLELEKLKIDDECDDLKSTKEKENSASDTDDSISDLDSVLDIHKTQRFNLKPQDSAQNLTSEFVEFINGKHIYSVDSPKNDVVTPDTPIKSVSQQFNFAELASSTDEDTQFSFTQSNQLLNLKNIGEIDSD
eukprot:TRINITY_DN3157_c4_g3_i1.p1 TRINITY_DN3157_c4_g3~~TRINITY_DN3157_c4_g3_i1.p1  ORF type:complete len:2896 (-),score=624.87 TRINITY_DN3157_c4_g3_i1:809-8509(-)